MKKIVIVLFLALALVAFATAEAKVTGEFTYGFTASSDGFSGVFDTIETDLNATVDDNNSVYFSLVGAKDATTGLPSFVAVSAAEVTTDWGALLGLPVGVKTTLGYDSFGVGDSLTVTNYAFEDWGGYYLGTVDSIKTVVSLTDTLSFITASTFHNAMNNSVFSLAGSFGIVNFTVDYTTVGDGMFGFELKAAQDVASGINVAVAGGLSYNLNSDAAAGTQYKYGFGTGVTASGAYAGISFNGNDDNALADLGVDATYQVTDAVKLMVASRFDMSDAAVDTYLGTDLSASYSAGAACYTLGYAAVGDGYGSSVTGAFNAVSSLPNGGLYMTVDISF